MDIDRGRLTYAQKVGERLRLVRKQKRLSLQAVEATSKHEFKASVLGAYERGERAISVPRLQRLAAFYSVPVDQLLPRNVGPDASWDSSDVVDISDASDAEPTLDRRIDDDRVSIDLTRLETLPGPDRDLLARYLGMIQLQRQDFNGKLLTIRRDDLRAIACMFETSIEAMRRRLDHLGLRLPA